MTLPSWWQEVRSGAVKDSPASLAIVNAYDRLGLALADSGGFRIGVRSDPLSYQEVRASTLLTAHRVAAELLKDKTVTGVYVNDVRIERPAPETTTSQLRRRVNVKAPSRESLVGRKVEFDIDLPTDCPQRLGEKITVVVDVGPLLASLDDPPIWNVGFTSAGAPAWGLGEAFKGTVSVRAADEGEARRRFSEQFGAGFVVTSASRMR